MKKIYFVFIFLLFLGLAFFQYKNHLYGVETSLYENSLCFMQERTLVQSDWQFFFKVLSLDRINTFCKKSYHYLYRPGLLAFTAIKDILWRDNYYISGASSIFFHAITIFLLFLFLLKIGVSLWISSFFSLFALFHYSGHPMIEWRLVSGYLIGFWLFLLGLESKRTLIKVLLLFGSTLFHESFAFSLILIAIYDKWALKKKEIYSYLIPVLAYFILNSTDYFLQSITDPIGNYAHGFSSIQKYLLLFLMLPINLCIAFGWMVAGFAIPQILHLKSEYQIIIFAILGGLSLFIGIKKLNKASQPILSYLFIFLLSLSFLLAGGRIGINGFEYLMACTYYQHLSIFVFTLFTANILYQRFSTLKTPLKIFLALLIINNLVYGFLRVQKIGKPSLEQETRMAKEILNASKFLNSGYCVTDTNASKFNDALPSILFYRQSCAVKSGIPITLLELHRRIQ